MRRMVALSLVLGCSPHTDEPIAPKVPPSNASISSVQLLMDCGGQDWPEPPPEAAAAAKAAKPSSVAAPSAGAAARMEEAQPDALGDSPNGFAADSSSFGCQQSQVMMAFTASTVDGARVDVSEVRLMFEDHTLGTMAPRRARIWKEGDTYERWDRRLPTTGETKASWDLADPDWSQVESRLMEIDTEKAKAAPSREASMTEEASKRSAGPRGKTWGRMFTLEADVVIDGISQTVRSGEFVREEVHMVVT